MLYCRSGNFRVFTFSRIFYFETVHEVQNSRIFIFLQWRYYNNNFREILEFANLSSSRNLRKLKWKNESGFRPPLCTYRLNWARRTSWGWWDDWDDTVLQTQDSKFEPWRSEAEHATSRSRRLPTILTFTRGWGRNNFCFFQTAETGNRTPDSGVRGSGANHHPRAPALAKIRTWRVLPDPQYQTTCLSSLLIWWVDSYLHWPVTPNLL